MYLNISSLLYFSFRIVYAGKNTIIEKISPCSNEKNAVSCGCENAVHCDEVNAVVSTGGGYAENEALIKKLKDFPRIILIDTAPAEIFYRIKKAAHKEGIYPAFL